MPFATDNEIQEIRNRADILHIIGEKVSLKRAGRNHKGCCPFHQEKTPSFMVNPDKQIFHCFGCGVGGDVFAFIMKYEGLDFPHAVESLADRYGVVLTQKGQSAESVAKNKSEKEILYKINQLAARFYFENLKTSEGQRGLDYLKKRDIRSEMIRESLLGYAPQSGKALYQLLVEKKAPLELAGKLGLIRRGVHGDYYDFFRDRVVCSIISAEGKILGFSGRALTDEVQPKYLNSPESPVYHKSYSLLGMQTAKEAIRVQDQVILVEGNFDMIRLQQEGLKNVVAPLGTALTEQQIRYLGRTTENFVLIFDGDNAGRKASARALELFLPLGIFPKVVNLPEGEDPDSFVRKEGVTALQERIQNAVFLLDYWVEQILSERLASEIKTGQGPQTQAKAIRKVAELVALVPGEIEKSLYIQRVAQRYGVQADFLIPVKKKLPPQRDSNFIKPSVDEVRKALPPIEKMVIELVIQKPELLKTFFRDISATDFSDIRLGDIWKLLVDHKVEALTTTAEADESRKELQVLWSELVITGSRWSDIERDEETKAAEDCVRQMKVVRFKSQLKQLSTEIRQAELDQDMLRVSRLLQEKNSLIKQMNLIH